MNEEVLLREITYKAVRSSGAGGQHVNKTASKVELHFDINASEALSENEKQRIYKKLSNRVTGSGELILQDETHRSQHKNKDEVTTRFIEIVKEALRKPKPRKKTKPSRAAKEKRLKAKKKTGEKKNLRQNPLKM